MFKYISLVMLAILAMGLPMVLRGPDGSPVMKPSDWLPESEKARDLLRKTAQMTEGASSTLEAATGVDMPGGKATYYRWQDAQGRWHYGDAPQEGSEMLVLPEPENRMSPPPAMPKSAGIEGDPRVQRLMEVMGQRLGQTSE